MSKHICNRCQCEFEYSGNVKRCDDCRTKCAQCDKPVKHANLCDKCRTAAGIKRRQMMKCQHPDCDTMLRKDDKRKGYCVKHTDWKAIRAWLPDFNRRTKSKPKHLHRKTEDIPSIPRICIVCQRSFLATPAAAKKGGGVVCSGHCHGIRAAQLTPKRDTSIELAIESVLKDLNIFYLKQHPLCGISLVDFYIPQNKIVIYCDGLYWHSTDKRKSQDAMQNQVLQENGYIVYRFTEIEIESSPHKCIARIKELKASPFVQLAFPIDEL